MSQVRYRVVDLTGELKPARPYIIRTRPVEYIALHHTDGPRDQPAKIIHDYHISLGWSGIGYHYLVRYPDNSGVAVVEKVRPVKTVPACVKGFNSSTVCVAMVGSYNEEEPQDFYLEAVCRFLSELVRSFGAVKVLGHREFPNQSTDCPGLKVNMDLVRKLVGNYTRQWYNRNRR